MKRDLSITYSIVERSTPTFVFTVLYLVPHISFDRCAFTVGLTVLNISRNTTQQNSDYPKFELEGISDTPKTGLGTAALVFPINMWVNFRMRSIDINPTVKLSNFKYAVSERWLMLL